MNEQQIQRLAEVLQAHDKALSVKEGQTKSRLTRPHQELIDLQNLQPDALAFARIGVINYD